MSVNSFKYNVNSFKYDDYLPSWVHDKDEKMVFDAAVCYGASVSILADKKITEEFLKAKREAGTQYNSFLFDLISLSKYSVINLGCCLEIATRTPWARNVHIQDAGKYISWSFH